MRFAFPLYAFCNAPFRDAAGPEWRGVLCGFIRGIADEIFNPFDRLSLALRVGPHRAVAFRQIASGDVWAREIVQNAADPPPPDDAVQAGIDIVLNRNRQFLGYGLPFLLLL
jgi:hypothetical protein